MSNYTREATHFSRGLLTDTRAGEGFFSDMPMDVYSRFLGKTLFVDFDNPFIFDGLDDLQVAAIADWATAVTTGAAAGLPWSIAESGTVSATRTSGNWSQKGGGLRIQTAAATTCFNAVMINPADRFSIPYAAVNTEQRNANQGPIVNLWSVRVEDNGVGFFFGLTDATAAANGATGAPLETDGDLDTGALYIGWYQDQGGVALSFTGTAVGDGNTKVDMTIKEDSGFDPTNYEVDGTGANARRMFFGTKINNATDIDFYFSAGSIEAMRHVGSVTLAASNDLPVDTAGLTPCFGASDSAGGNKNIFLQKMVTHQPNQHRTEVAGGA